MKAWQINNGHAFLIYPSHLLPFPMTLGQINIMNGANARRALFLGYNVYVLETSRLLSQASPH